MKNQKFKTTTFWLGICGSVVIVLDSISSAFNINLYSREVESIIMSICSVLVMLGIITKKNTSDKKEFTKDELLEELDVDSVEMDIQSDEKEKNNNKK